MYHSHFNVYHYIGTTSASMFNRSSDFPFGILLVVAIGVALGVFLGGLLLVLAVLYMKR